MNSLVVVAQFLVALAHDTLVAVALLRDMLVHGAFAQLAGGATASSPWLLLAGLVVVTATLALAVVVSRAARTAGAPDARTRTRSHQNADLATLVTQSHPAAPGHVRSCAPGRALRAA